MTGGVFLRSFITKKRELFGYNPVEVITKMKALQDQYVHEKERLEQLILEEKERTHNLKSQLKELKEQLFKGTTETLNVKIIEAFYKHHRALLDFKFEIDNKEKLLEETLVKKIEQKKIAQKTIQEARDYLNNQLNELMKERINK